MTAGTLALLAALAGGYLAGSVPFGLLLTRAAGLGDVRRIGSGNIGATNVLRTGRKGLAAATLLLDALKGAAPVLVAGVLAGREAALVAGAGAVAGHILPVWLGFAGGKGVATGLGVLLAAAWPVGVLACATWAAAAAVTRVSSAGALAAFALAPLYALLLADRGLALLAVGVAVAVAIKHHANIRRILAGAEPRIGQKKPAAPAAPADPAP